MKAENVKVGLKIDLPDQSQIEIVKDGFVKDGFQSVEYKFNKGQFVGQTETAAVASIQEAFDNGAKVADEPRVPAGSPEGGQWTK